MAFFASILGFVLLHLLFLILSRSFFHQAHKLVEADGKLSREECHNSGVPYTCIRCVKTDPGAAKADRLGIATIMAGCLSNQAMFLAANMIRLDSNENSQTLKQCYRNCSNVLSNGAVEELYSAKEALKNHKYNNAESYVVRALKFNFLCPDDIESYVVRVPVDAVFNIRIYEELTESACRIIERLFNRLSLLKSYDFLCS